MGKETGRGGATTAAGTHGVSRRTAGRCHAGAGSPRDLCGSGAAGPQQAAARCPSMRWLLAAGIVVALFLRFPQVLEAIIWFVDVWSVVVVLAVVIGVIMVKARR